MFIMLSSTFTQITVFSSLWLIFLTSILSLTSLRRTYDAKLNKKWVLAPSLTFVTAAIMITLASHNSSYYLLIIPALCSSLLSMYPSRHKLHFILGYYGPVDMNEYEQNTHKKKQPGRRIEPTFANQNSGNIDKTINEPFHSDNIGENNQYPYKESPEKKRNLSELIRLTLINCRKTQLIIIAVIGLTCIASSTAWVISYLNTTDDILVKENNSESDSKSESMKPIISRHSPLAMPDQYMLYLSEHQGLTINWEADEVTSNMIWSQWTTQGDDSCKEVTFNQGEPIRTLSVQVEKIGDANINYFAHFSPLDTQALIQALAFRGSFTLCGYNFSLKGSQATLGQSEQYRQWINY